MCVPEISATEASRRFADLLDAVEHGGQEFTIVRRGRAIADLRPATARRGAEVKSLLRRHRPDPSWRSDLDAVRDLLEVDDRT